MSTATPVFTPEQLAAKVAAGEPLPQHFIRSDGVSVHLTAGAAITRPENARITPAVREALVALADLVEYHGVGGDDVPCDLSNMIDSGAAYKAGNEAQLRALVATRLQRLEAWLAEKAPAGAPAKTRAQFTRERRTFKAQSMRCVAALRDFAQ